MPTNARALLALSFVLAASAASGADHGTVEARIAACKAAGETGKHRCFAKPHHDGKVNLFYGWNVGKGHPIDNNDPPPHDRLLNGLDQCGWYHDRGAGRWNPRTKVCEGTFTCANSVFLYRCLKSYPPVNADETAAKEATLKRVAPLLSCIPKLYKEYGVEWVKDAHGSPWLSVKAEQQLAEAFHHCKPGMATPGWPTEELKAYWLGLVKK
jgi:hypothetical protein